MNQSYKNPKMVDRKFLTNVLVMAGMLVVFFFGWGFAGISRFLNEEEFASGVSVAQVSVAGMNLEEAQAAVSAHTQQLPQKTLILSCLNHDEIFDLTELGFSYDVEGALKKAFMYNKAEEDGVEQRFNKTVFLSNGQNFEPLLVVDEAKLREKLEKYTAQYFLSPIDAKTIYDSKTETFSFLPEKDGRMVDVDQLFEDVVGAVVNNDFSGVTATVKNVRPRVTVSELRENTYLLAAFETVAENSPSRNTNISLITAAVNGVEIKPGETLSINELVGQRTAEKGYKAASAISDGLLIDQLGGGICQLAGTLYNAALLADMEIVERIKHTWPSAYLPIGQDSTLNWNNKDLKIKNKSEYSMYIGASFKNQKVTVKIYGQPLEDGVTISVQNDIIKEIEPGRTEIRYSKDLVEGTSQVIRKAQKGYHVKVYRIYSKDGVEIKREVVSEDHYPALNKIVLLGRASSKDK